MTEGRTIVGDASTNSPDELEKWASEAAHAKFAEWHRKEGAERRGVSLVLSCCSGDRGCHHHCDTHSWWRLTHVQLFSHSLNHDKRRLWIA